MMDREIEVVLELARPVAAPFGLQLDEEDSVGPEHAVVGPAGMFGLVPAWEFELVDELE